MKLVVNVINSVSAPLVRLAEKLGVIKTVWGADGEHYTPYVTKVKLGGRLRLHIFHRGDADPDLHDHPWSFWTFPLTSYLEEVQLDGRRGKIRTRGFVRRLRLHYRPAEYTHRVVSRAEIGRFGYPEMVPGKIVTLVWLGPTTRSWGFSKWAGHGKACWVPWHDYVYGGGKAAPCLDQP